MNRDLGASVKKKNKGGVADFFFSSFRPPCATPHPLMSLATTRTPVAHKGGKWLSLPACDDDVNLYRHSWRGVGGR